MNKLFLKMVIMTGLLFGGMIAPDKSASFAMFAAYATVYCTFLKSRMWKIALTCVYWGRFLVSLFGFNTFPWSIACVVIMGLAIVWGRDDDGESPFKKLFARPQAETPPVAFRGSSA